MGYTSQLCCEQTIGNKIAMCSECCFPNCTKLWRRKLPPKVLAGVFARIASAWTHPYKKQFTDDCETWSNVITIPATCCWFWGCGWSLMNRRNTFERKKTVRGSLFWNVSDTVVRSTETDERLVALETTLSLWRCQNKLRSKANLVLML